MSATFYEALDRGLKRKCRVPWTCVYREFYARRKPDEPGAIEVGRFAFVRYRVAGCKWGKMVPTKHRPFIPHLIVRPDHMIIGVHVDPKAIEADMHKNIGHLYDITSFFPDDGPLAKVDVALRNMFYACVQRFPYQSGNGDPRQPGFLWSNVNIVGPVRYDFASGLCSPVDVQPVHTSQPEKRAEINKVVREFAAFVRCLENLFFPLPGTKWEEEFQDPEFVSAHAIYREMSRRKRKDRDVNLLLCKMTCARAASWYYKHSKSIPAYKITETYERRRLREWLQQELGAVGWKMP
jgi:hypothetical protein